MEDVAVEFLLENLQQLLLYHAHLIKDAKEQVERLERDLRLFKSFLKDSTKKRRRDDSLRELVCEIHDVVYEAEDIIDAFVSQAIERRSKHYFVRAFQTPAKLLTIAKQVEKVGYKIRDIYGDKGEFDFASLNVGDGGPQDSEVPILREKNVVGFEDQMNAVIGYLTERTEKLDVITLVGMPGIGKTTLAWKIFNDPRTHYEFPLRIWVHVTNEFTEKRVFLTILRQCTLNTDEVMHKSEEELYELVVSHLKSKKFLIVFDDVWSVSDWNKLRIVGLESNITTGKVLITSCNEEVGRYANRYRAPHKVRLLFEGESWELLQLEVFGDTTKCPPELETIGKLIAKECDGLPLAILTIGGILAREDVSCVDLKARKATWTKACQNVPKYRNMKFYDNLPCHLKPCFLYLAVFPYDFEIPVGQLILMWIAEGFIREKDGLCLEETAEKYLEDLICRNLLKISQSKSDGRVKTCRIHRMLHDFCKTEAGNQRENMLTEIKFTDGVFEPPISQVPECRRLSIHSNVLNFLSSKPFGPRIRSLVSFSKEEICLLGEYISAIPEAFRLLRILNVNPIKFTRLPSDMYHLIHLRYLALSFHASVLPRAFSKFWNIQTLVINTTSRFFDMKADIMGFTQLRHFKTNASTVLSRPGKTCEGGEKLQSLGTIAPESCTQEVFKRALNLKKLGIRGRLSSLLEGKIGSFDSLVALKHLENLKLLNDVYPLPTSEGRLRGLPKPDQFPPSLRSLTLTDTFLDWSKMSTLGLLEQLEVLKLKDNAFMGRIWETNDGGFRRLEALHIAQTDLVIWVASAHHFPQLRSLRLRYCEELQEVPIALADISSFRLLDLFESKLAAASARRLLDKKLKEQSMDAENFKLYIYPPSYDELSALRGNQKFILNFNF